MPRASQEAKRKMGLMLKKKRDKAKKAFDNLNRTSGSMNYNYEPVPAAAGKHKMYSFVLARDIPDAYWAVYDSAYVVSEDSVAARKSLETGAWNKLFSKKLGRPGGGQYQDSANKSIWCLIPTEYMAPAFNDLGEVAP